MSLDKIAYRMAMHLIGVHCNAAVIGEHSFAALSDAHEHEHFGPGGIRNHLYDDLRFDESRVEEVLEEAEREGGPDPRQLCPDQGVCGHFCDRGRCFRVMSCAPFTDYYPDEEPGRWPLNIKIAELNGTLENYS